MIAASGKLIVELQNQERTRLQIDAPANEGIVIGRSDTMSEYVPDFDLAPYGARQLGVSRRHAVLVQFKQAVHMVDLGSVNGTFINEVQIQPHIPVALSAGDHIRLGSLIAMISHLDK